MSKNTKSDTENQELKTVDSQLLVAAEFAQKNASRPIFGSVAVFPDNKIVATDSYILIEIDNSDNLPVDEFPKIEGETPEKTTEKPILFPADELLKHQKFSKKNKSLPILNNGVISSVLKDENGDMNFASINTTNLTTTQTNKYRLIQGNYPDYKQVIPDIKEMKFTYIDPTLLIRALKAFSGNSVAIATQDGTKPLLLIGLDSDSNKRALVMPTKGDGSFVKNNKFYKE